MRYAAVSPLLLLRSCLVKALTCRNVTFSAGATGSQLLNSVASFDIAATYCEPMQYESTSSRSSTVQVLVHGAAYTRTYWSSLGLNDSVYNWVEYAAQEGYATIAIDRPCNGASSHPVGTACTVATEAEAIHHVIQQIRSSTTLTAAGSPNLDTVILVGHSVGSEICSYIAQIHPKDANALILTGWSNEVTNGVLTIPYGQPLPAAQVYPSRFGNLGLTYLTFASETGQSYLSYYGDFDITVQRYDYATQGTFTVGEASTTMLGQPPALAYAGPVFVLNGNEDATYCQSSLASAAVMSIGNCSAGVSAAAKANFPAARVFAFFNTPNTGHSLNLHRTAPLSYHAVFTFMAEVGL